MLFTYFLSLYRVVGIVLSIYANFHSYYGPVIGIFILKIDCPRQFVTCSVDVVLLVMCIPVFIVPSASYGYIYAILPEASCCNVYGAWVTL